MTGVHLVLYRDEFCGPRFDNIRQVALVTTNVFLQSDPVQNLEDEIKRSQDFKKLELLFNLFCYPMTADIDTAREELQLELIDLKSDNRYD
ncbi:hypothetical protein TNCV_1087971 [Trichonephila clavipes]|uniref:Uncharacterized protein n=1 Tax=Trichonephila clavipes TaxID=2585209 RepID=A0A8X6SSP6_TRICX|nr:hypothetical protein TNCV_1087971 [Trichonephila clavipes]